VTPDGLTGFTVRGGRIVEIGSIAIPSALSAWFHEPTKPPAVRCGSPAGSDRPVDPTFMPGAVTSRSSGVSL
jgi:hypothetical protein